MPRLQIPTLEGPRLSLEPLSSSHSPGMFALWRHSEVCEYSGPCVDVDGATIDLPAASHSESDRLLEFWLHRAAAGTGFRWAVVSQDRSRFLGAVGFNALGECAEYACHFVHGSWGKGLAGEAAGLALSWARASGSRSAEMFVLPENLRSVRLAERLGFEHVGRGKDGMLRFELSFADGAT